MLFLHNNKGLHDVFLSTETSWQLVMESISGIDASLRETVVDELENLIDVKYFRDTLNISQAKHVQMVGLTGWREVVLQATDEVRLAIGLCLFS